MDTNHIKRFATEARKALMQGVRQRLLALGFNEKGETASEPQLFEGGALFQGHTVSVDFYEKWRSLHRVIEDKGIDYAAEEAAYTWFNRFAAIRILVKNGLLSPVLSYESEDSRVPMIVSEARRGILPEMDEQTRVQLDTLLNNDALTAGQFALLIVAFCHANPIIRSCFGSIKDYTELLLPTNILAQGEFVDMLNHTTYLTDDDYRSPELIGWLYQFYISEKKDDVFASFKKGKKAEAEDIPAATQIFTPNWIVKYMVQNTVGCIYLDNNPYSDLKDGMKYLVQPAEKSPEEAVLSIDDLHELTCADLACGSGHILNECFDLLYACYLEEGYSSRQAVEDIFRYNLTGVDLDTRAKQLAEFALLLKACQKDNSFADAHCLPRVLDMPKPYADKENLHEALRAFIGRDDATAMEELTAAICLMDNARNLGSIMKFQISDATRGLVESRMETCEGSADERTETLLPYLKVILALTKKYAALVMNPPYMGGGNMNEELAKYVKKNYAVGKADLFSVFMLVAQDALKAKGKYGMITMQSWMFLSSFEQMRKKLLEQTYIDNMLHLGSRTFDELSGEVVQNVAFVFTNTQPYGNGVYCRLVDGKSCKEKEILFLEGENVYSNVSQQNFEKIPGSPIGYWVSEKIFARFAGNLVLSAVCKPTQGLATADNTRFLRYWTEVNMSKIGFGMKSSEEALESGRKWFPINKGGSQRKWYGAQDYVVNWENDGYEIKHFDGAVIRNPDFYFRECISWSDINSGKTIGFKYYPQGFIYEVCGRCCFDMPNLLNMLGVLNTPLYPQLVKLLNPTIHFQVGDFKKLPYLEVASDSFDNIVKENISISKKDWNANELSWDFEENPLLSYLPQDGEEGKSHSLSDLYDRYTADWEAKFMQLHTNEEELNRRFFEIYDLADELSPDVLLDEITILQQGEISIEEGASLK